MPTYTQDDSSWKLKVVSAGTLTLYSPHVWALMNAVLVMHGSTPIFKVVLNQKPLPDLDQFVYKIILQDGKEWRQLLKVTPTGVKQQFDVTDWWELAEYSKHRPIRDAVCNLMLLDGVTDIKVEKV